MYGLIYLSESIEEFSEEQLTRLSEQFAENNNRLGITGYLCFSGRRFIQYLEGERAAVFQLMNAIRADQRHRMMFEIPTPSREERLFPSWGMRFISTEEARQFNNEQYVEQNLLYIKNDFGHKERCKELLWMHLETISRVRTIRRLH